MSAKVDRRPQYGPSAVIALLLLALTSCSDSDKTPVTPSTASRVCDGKLAGSVFGPLVGDGGITSEDTTRFHPTTWKAYGDCWLYGAEHSVRISYLWRKTVNSGAGTSTPRNGTSPTPSSTFAGTVDTFTVDSVTGAVTNNRAVVDMPCVAPGVFDKGKAVLEIEVKDMPPAQGLDATKRRQFATAATKAADYLAGDVFSC
ncbi:hypothetical protein [Streptomyces sp. NPDC102360]|uniref:hypothetical protein n=1 Tax=Streptomyces sp. NPDC102360 TaxID=3366160 RepID=UPI0037F61575